MMKTEKEIREFLDEIKKEDLGEYIIPKSERQKKLEHLLENIKSGDIEQKALYTAIHILGEAKCYEAEKTVELFLKHEDPDLRNIALNVLGIHWDSKEHHNVFESFLFDEKEDDENRAMAAACLGYVMRGNKDKPVLKILLSFFKDENIDWFIRDRAYHAILNVWGVSLLERPSSAKKLDYKKDVDWKLIQEIENYLQS